MLQRNQGEANPRDDAREGPEAGQGFGTASQVVPVCLFTCRSSWYGIYATSGEDDWAASFGKEVKDIASRFDGRPLTDLCDRAFGIILC